MKFYKAFKMKTDNTAEGGFKFSLCSTECYEESGELVDIEVGYDGSEVVDEVVKKDGVELEVSCSAKRCLENAVTCGYPFFFKVEVPEGAVIDEDVEHGYTVVKEFRIVRELTFDDMMVLAAKEENSGAVCEGESECGDTEGKYDSKESMAVVAQGLVERCEKKILELGKREALLEVWEETLNLAQADAEKREKKQMERIARVERENWRLRSEVFERKRTFPLWLGSAAVISMVVGYFIGLIVGVIA